MKITVIGAVGRLGWHVAQEASRRNHQVTGLARHPDRLPDPRLFPAITGDGRDPEAVGRAVGGAEAVVITVSGGRRNDPHQLAEVTRTVTASMQDHGVQRLVITSAYPLVATDPKAIMWLMRRLLATPYADTAEAERIVTASDLTWTIARLNRLTDHRSVGAPHISTGMLDRPVGLSRADVATLLVDLAENGDHARRAINVRGQNGRK
ncbi:NAD(P)-binding oxidoreductase [Actinopolymorpha sp. NPDC004070]|uniref:NAD(P)-dependent oxidoreductase n=1 Tax=Actinopolymorpha sp. NPDC004070 TaxID=3154548 RepID=UPI0033A0B41E